MKKLFSQLLSKIYRSNLYIFFVMFAILSLTTALLYNRPIRSDGKGYYLYLPSIFIYQDPSMNWTKLPDAHEPNGDQTIEYYGVSDYQDSGKRLNKYPVGLAIIWAPFFIAADILTRIFGLERNGFGIFYQFGVNLAGVFFGAGGFIVLIKLLEQSFTRKVAVISASILFFGTNLYHYSTSDLAYTHVYSFALITILMYLLPGVYADKPKAIYISACLLALATLIRPTNLIFLVFMLLYDIKSQSDLSERLYYFKSNLKYITTAGALFILCTLPQIVYWLAITGKPVVFSYQGEHFNFANPQIVNVLFSVQKGLFFWAPILLLAIPGLYFVYKKHKRYFLPILFYTALSTYIISSWWAWQYGGSYGHRAFIDSFAVFAIPISAFISVSFTVSWHKRLALYSLILAVMTLNLYMTIQYWQGNLPIENTSWSQYFDLLVW